MVKWLWAGAARRAQPGGAEVRGNTGALPHRRAAQEGERVRVSPGKMTYWKKQ